MQSDHEFMSRALRFARESASRSEVPVGAVLVQNGKVIGGAGNSPIFSSDPTAHAEINTIRLAASAVRNYRLVGTTLYTTLEPCVMCAGAIIHARISRLVFGAYDPKSGACGSVVDLFSEHNLNHHTTVMGGVLQTECSEVLQTFFKSRR
ncbi:MAG: tRNA adenosine(34) deaminase TadA [Burkholderiales bacterium]|nr:tRNA adenosine(34) deaminase TadA [Burkholderiales bacterium]MDG1226238.1 tRNA adenosine(34) deaminase TadA [Burkholderiales bacterium]